MHLLCITDKLERPATGGFDLELSATEQAVRARRLK